MRNPKTLSFDSKDLRYMNFVCLFPLKHVVSVYLKGTFLLFDWYHKRFLCYFMHFKVNSVIMLNWIFLQDLRQCVNWEMFTGLSLKKWDAPLVFFVLVKKIIILFAQKIVHVSKGTINDGDRNLFFGSKIKM